MQRGMRFQIILEEAPEGGFTARCVEIPGAISEGASESEALKNVADAISSILAFRRAQAATAVRRRHHRLETVEV